MQYPFLVKAFAFSLNLLINMLEENHFIFIGSTTSCSVSGGILSSKYCGAYLNPNSDILANVPICGKYCFVHFSLL